ncbi:MAG TPA: hypothetical protein VFM65_11515 [Flavobacteriaceae bacterium]|nr:hypothetical protein [Flavobacteriaceae bacterium]
MDELELLKKDWKAREKDLPRLKASEIYPMLLKKSSSIVKWIFIISIIELALSTFLNIYLADDEFWAQVKNIHFKNVMIGIYIFSYLATGVFIFLFYKNYKNISTTDSASQLMKNILKTRRVVKYYILYVLVSSGITMILYFVFSIMYPPAGSGIDPEKLNWGWALLIAIGVTLLFLTLLWLFYLLVYGILLRKLKRNYKELKKLEL